MQFTPAQWLRQGIEQARQLGDIAPMDAPARATHVEELSERDEITGTLIAELWKLAKQGYFADPIYGGNRDMVAWHYVGFPGTRYDYRDFVDHNGARIDLPPVSLMGLSLTPI